jgi:hypothetical protein
MSATMQYGYQNLIALQDAVADFDPDFAFLQGSNALSFGSGSMDLTSYLSHSWQMYEYDSAAHEGVAPSLGVALFSHTPLTNVRFISEPCRKPDRHHQPCTGRALGMGQVRIGGVLTRLITAGPRLDAIALAWVEDQIDFTMPTIVALDYDAAANVSRLAHMAQSSRGNIWFSRHFSSVSLSVESQYVLSAVALSVANVATDAAAAAAAAAENERLTRERTATRSRNGIVILLIGAFLPVLVLLTVVVEQQKLKE